MPVFMIPDRLSAVPHRIAEPLAFAWKFRFILRVHTGTHLYPYITPPGSGSEPTRSQSFGAMPTFPITRTRLKPLQHLSASSLKSQACRPDLHLCVTLSPRAGTPRTALPPHLKGWLSGNSQHTFP